MPRRAALLALVIVGLGLAGRALAADLGPSSQALLFLRVLAYDRNVKSRAGSELNIAVVYKEKDADSEAARAAMVTAIEEAAKKFTVSDLPVRVHSVAYAGAAPFEAKLGELKVAAAFVCPGLADAVADVSKVTRKRSALSATSSEAFVKAGLAIGFVQRAKPTVLVNLPAAQAEGADLDAALLRVAEVIQ